MVNYSGSNLETFSNLLTPDITHLSIQSLRSIYLDSALVARLPGKTGSQYTIFLPFTAQIGFSKPLMHDRLVLTFGVQYRDLPGYYAYGYIKINYFLKADMVISASAGSGGYSLLNAGLEFSKSWKYIDVTVGSSNLFGLILPSYYPGTAFYIRLASSF